MLDLPLKGKMAETCIAESTISIVQTTKDWPSHRSLVHLLGVTELKGPQAIKT